MVCPHWLKVRLPLRRVVQMDSGLATVKADGHRAILPGHTGVFWGRGGGYHVICGWICLVG